MKNKLFFLLTFTISSTAFCQMDTIYSNNEKLAVNVKEITEDAVKYTYPNEDLINTSYKNTIQKIVLKSGRVQTFNERVQHLIKLILFKILKRLQFQTLNPRLKDYTKLQM